eukprot:RCo050686
MTEVEISPAFPKTDLQLQDPRELELLKLYRAPPFKTTQEACFAKHFLPDCRGVPRADQYILRHHNDICVVGLAPFHPMLASPTSEIKEVRYQLKKGKVNRLLDVHTTGKHKKGCFSCHPDTVLCEVEANDGTVYSVVAGITGYLYELNEVLQTEPYWLRVLPYTNGYVAVIQPSNPKSLAAISRCIGEEEYYQRRSKSPAGSECCTSATETVGVDGGGSTTGGCISDVSTT